VCGAVTVSEAECPQALLEVDDERREYVDRTTSVLGQELGGVFEFLGPPLVIGPLALAFYLLNEERTIGNIAALGGLVLWIAGLVWLVVRRPRRVVHERRAQLRAVATSGVAEGWVGIVEPKDETLPGFGLPAVLALRELYDAHAPDRVYLRVLSSVDFWVCAADGTRVAVGATALVSGPCSDLHLERSLYGGWAGPLLSHRSIRERQFLVCAGDTVAASGVVEVEHGAAGYRDEPQAALRHRPGAPLALEVHELKVRSQSN
jgi:hypothetical protein